MTALLRLFDRVCLLVIGACIRLAVVVDNLRRRLPLRARRWRGSLRRVYRNFFGDEWGPTRPARPRRHPWNKTPEHLEEKLVRLHVDQPLLGAGQLRSLCERLFAFSPGRETIRRILSRRRALVVAMEDERRPRPRRIRVSGPRQLWGADTTLVWVLGFIPVGLLGIVDYHGSRLVAFERTSLWPSAKRIAHLIEKTIAEHGAPARLLTDRAPVFASPPIRAVLAEHSVRHIQTKPHHPWTNGRIERMFRTYKETVARLVWLVASRSQLDRFVADFKQWHNRDRPHSSWGGRTPDEVFFGRAESRLRSLGPASYFDGRLSWYRFG